MKKIKGFTLIEMLVVIAIIGILATLVTINVISVQSKARDTKRKTDASAILAAFATNYATTKHFYLKDPITGKVGGNNGCHTPVGGTNIYSAGFIGDGWYNAENPLGTYIYANQSCSLNGVESKLGNISIPDALEGLGYFSKAPHDPRCEKDPNHCAWPAWTDEYFVSFCSDPITYKVSGVSIYAQLENIPEDYKVVTDGTKTQKQYFEDKGNCYHYSGYPYNYAVTFK